MAQYKYVYKEVLERTVIVDRPDDALSFQQRIGAALDDAWQQYRDEQIILTADDLSERSIQVVDMATGGKFDVEL